MGQWNLAETTLGLARDAEYKVAVLPVGATEAHGMHLPYATDTIQVEALAKEACRRADSQGAEVLLLPAIPYGVNENNLGFKWTISIKPSTFLAIFADIVSSLEAHVIPNLLILNGHGGNEFQPHLRELCRQTEVHIMLVNWYMANRQAAAEIFEAEGEHADEMETSLLSHLRPDLVVSELAGDGAVREPVLTAMKEGWAWVARPWERFTYDSGFGDPSRASAEKGQRYFEAVVGKLSQLLVEMSGADIDDLYPYTAG